VVAISAAATRLLQKQMALSSQLLNRYFRLGRRPGPIGSCPSVVNCVGLFLLAALLLLCGCDAESAKWDLARAQNSYESGDLSGAIEFLESAHEKLPQGDYIKLLLAKRYAENGQGELGVGMCNEYLKDHPNDVEGFAARSQCWQYQGKFDEGLADYKRSLSDHVGRDTGELNNLAYNRALAGKEIDKATAGIQTAIKSFSSALMPVKGSGVRIPLQVGTAVFAGVVSRSIGKHEEAIEVLDNKIEQYEEKLSVSTEILKTLVTGLLRNREKLSKKEESGVEKIRSSLQGQKESLAAMLSIRALVLEDLGEEERADRDRLAVKELDFELEEICNRLPSDFHCLAALREASMLLDTRGFVLGRQQWTTDEHLQLLLAADLDLAILAARFEHLGLESSLCNSTELAPEDVKKWKKHNKKTRAVLLYHRKLVHLREGNEEAAAADQKSIDELGFKDSRLLF